MTLLFNHYEETLENIFYRKKKTMKKAWCISQARYYFRKYQKKLQRKLELLENYYTMPIFLDEEEDDVEYEYYSIVSKTVNHYCKRLSRKLATLS
jgi:hypothetical protein